MSACWVNGAPGKITVPQQELTQELRNYTNQMTSWRTLKWGPSWTDGNSASDRQSASSGQSAGWPGEPNAKPSLNILNAKPSKLSGRTKPFGHLERYYHTVYPGMPRSTIIAGFLLSESPNNNRRACSWFPCLNFPSFYRPIDQSNRTQRYQNAPPKRSKEECPSKETADR